MSNAELSIEALLALPTSEIAMILYEQSDVQTFGSQEPTDEDKADRGFALFWEYIAPFRDRLCSSEFIVKAGASETTQLVAAIADVIIGSKGGLPVVVVVAMTIKIGLNRVCNEKSR